MISGYIKPDSGHITFNDQDITNWNPHRTVRAGISRTFQIGRPFSNMSVLENVCVGLLYGNKGIRDMERAKKSALEILEFTKLIDKRATRSGDLNTVDLRRLEISRALASGPQLVMLDETMAGLNDKELSEIFDVINAIRNNLGITVLLVEHVMRAIMTLSDFVVVLDRGQKIAEGRPSEIARNKTVIEAYLGSDDSYGPPS